MARFIEVAAQGTKAIVNVDEIAYITPAGDKHCQVQFATGVSLHVNVSMHEMYGRMQDAKPFGS